MPSRCGRRHGARRRSLRRGSGASNAAHSGPGGDSRLQAVLADAPAGSDFIANEADAGRGRQRHLPGAGQARRACGRHEALRRAGGDGYQSAARPMQHPPGLGPAPDRCGRRPGSPATRRPATACPYAECAGLSSLPVAEAAFARLPRPPPMRCGRPAALHPRQHRRSGLLERAICGRPGRARGLQCGGDGSRGSAGSLQHCAPRLLAAERPV